MWRKGEGRPESVDLQLVEASRGGDGGGTEARDEATEDVIGKKTEGVVGELTEGASVGDENMVRQESGVVGGVGSSLSITLQTLQLQEHRLPVGHCQEEKETVAAPGSARACCPGQQG